MTLKRLQFTVILGFLMLIGIACSADQNKPLDPPFESLIPKCEYFAPLFDSAKAKMITPYVALRRCSGNQIELSMRLNKFPDSAASSRFMEDLKKDWNELGRRISNRDYSYTAPQSTTVRDDSGPLDEYFEVDMGREAECLIGGGEQFFYGSAFLSYIRVGSFVGEYAVVD